MTSINVQNVLSNFIKGLDDDLLEYLVSAVEDMSIDERRNHQSIQEVISPFLVDSGTVDETGAEDLCKKISIAFGGSGYKNSVLKNESDAPLLLSAPVRMIDNSGLQPVKATYGGAILGDSTVEDSNSLMDITNVPTTQKQVRKMRRENELVQRILRAEAVAEEARRLEIQAARMAAIKARNHYYHYICIIGALNSHLFQGHNSICYFLICYSFLSVHRLISIL